MLLAVPRAAGGARTAVEVAVGEAVGIGIVVGLRIAGKQFELMPRAGQKRPVKYDRRGRPLTAAQREVFDALGDLPVSRIEIARRLERSENSVSAALYALASKNRAVKVGREWKRAA